MLHLRGHNPLCRFAAAILLAAALPTCAQKISISKIDPPNWYAALPKPMLLLRGEHLTGARFTLSDPALTVEETVISASGHYAQLWLSASPAHSESVLLNVTGSGGTLSIPYHFAARRPTSDGMAGFSQSDVMYLIVTDRFADGNLANDGPQARDSASSPAAEQERAKLRGWHGGDLAGIAQHLDYLQQLGVTTLWPTPVYQNQSPDAFHGYHATDYYSVDQHYGTLADLQSLVQSLHARHMKLILDTVPNHVGPLHPWVQDEPAPDWFHGNAAKHIAGETDFHALIDPHATPASRIPTLQGWFVNSLPDMNTDSPAVAKYLRQNAIWWIEQTGADGLRIDTFPYVDRPFWHDFMAELKELYPRLTEVGEVSNPDPEVTSAFADGVTRAGLDTGLYTPFDFPFFHAARDIFAGSAPFTRLTRVLTADELYLHPERLVPFLGNHDESRLAEDVRDPALRQVAYTLLLTTRGTPQLYAGDELAQRGGDDPYNRSDFPGGFAVSPAGSPPGGFTAAGRTEEQQREFLSIQQLLALRKAHPALQTGAEQILHADAETLVYLRTLPEEQVLIALNKGRSTQTVTIALTGTAAGEVHKAVPLLATSGTAAIKPDDLDELIVTLAPQSALISSLR